LLVFQRVHRFTIQALSVSVDDLDIFAIPRLPFQLSQVGSRGPLQQRRPVLVHTVHPSK
jgi:hypothetical protein